MVQDKIYIYGKHALMEALLHRPKVLSRYFSLHRQMTRELRERSKARYFCRAHGCGNARKTWRRGASRCCRRGIAERVNGSMRTFANDARHRSDTALLLLKESAGPA